MTRHWGNTFLVAMARALCIFFITGMPTIRCFVQASYLLFCAGQGGLKIGAAPRTGGTQANRFSNNAAIHKIRKSAPD